MPDVGTKADWSVSERAAALHADALVCDMIVNWEDDLDAECRHRGPAAVRRLGRRFRLDNVGR